MRKKKTKRGFSLIEFNDSNGLTCSIQKSSSADEDKIWFGISNDIVRECRVDTMEGWQNIDLNSIKHAPENSIIVENRMHLNQKQVAELIPILQEFVKTGEI